MIFDHDDIAQNYGMMDVRSEKKEVILWYPEAHKNYCCWLKNPENQFGVTITTNYAYFSQICALHKLHSLAHNCKIVILYGNSHCASYTFTAIVLNLRFFVALINNFPAGLA